MNTVAISAGYCTSHAQIPIFTGPVFVPCYENRGFRRFSRVSCPLSVIRQAQRLRRHRGQYRTSVPDWDGCVSSIRVLGRSTVRLRCTVAVRQSGVGTFKPGQQGKPRPLIQQQWQRFSTRGTRGTEPGYPRCAPSHGHSIWECV